MGSVDTSLSDLVTIIVKAPNQQIADQTIKCHLNWSIKKLKDYLSQVYPSKPKLEEQKLIYSGKLLTDTAILKDVLRMYEGQENHTVHLVCTSKISLQKSVKKPTPRTNTTDSTSSYNSNTQAVNQENDHASSPTSPQITPTFPFNGSGAPFFGSVNPNQLPSMNNFDTRFIWSGANAFGGVNDINANQLAMMQQAYAQYISQYMQMIGQPGLGYMTTHLSNPVSRTPSQPAGILFNNANNNVNNLPRVRQPLIEEDVPDPPAAAVGAVGNDLDDEDNRNNRDWLDWFYVLSRVVVLFSVVYFYSTPLRLLAVLLLLCMFYLHQNMRLQNDQFNANNNNNNDNNIVNHNNNQNNDNVNNHQNDEAVNPPPATTSTTPEEAANRANEQQSNETLPATTTQPEPTAPIQERLSPIAVAVLAIRTFFLSLVPDQPVV